MESSLPRLGVFAPASGRSRFGFVLFDLAILYSDRGDFNGAGSFLSRAVDEHLWVLGAIEAGNPMVDLCDEYQGLVPEQSGRIRGTEFSSALARAVDACEGY